MNTNLETIVKRDGKRAPFDKKKILAAIEKSFLSLNISDIATVANLTDQVVNLVVARYPQEVELTVENIQDIAEEILMKNGHFKVARNYIVYREKHKVDRQETALTQIREQKLEIVVDESHKAIFDPQIINDRIVNIASDLTKIDVLTIVESVSKQVYEGITKKEIDLLVLGSAKERI
ncbi:hypothetical protein HOH87_01290, partial [bacterium]|nr:hypothetical protein [bacterium]